MAASSNQHIGQAVFANRNMWSGILFGIGLAAFIDEAVFHQLLRWHHFYDKSTTDIGLISDGLFHAFSWFRPLEACLCSRIFADETNYSSKYGGQES